MPYKTPQKIPCGPKVPFTTFGIRASLPFTPQKLIRITVFKQAELLRPWWVLAACRLGDGMKTKLSQDMAGWSPISSGRISNAITANEQVRQEIESFLRALDSYPDRVAVSPGISFEEHLGSFVHASDPAPRRRMLNAR